MKQLKNETKMFSFMSNLRTYHDLEPDFQNVDQHTGGKWFKDTKNVIFLMSSLQTYNHFKLDFQKVDQHTGGKWLIHGTKCRKDNQ